MFLTLLSSVFRRLFYHSLSRKKRAKPSRFGKFRSSDAGQAYFLAELLVAEMISSCLAMNSFISE